MPSNETQSKQKQIANHCPTCNARGHLIHGKDTKMAEYLLPVNPRIGKHTYIAVAIMSMLFFNVLLAPFFVYAIYLMSMPTKAEKEAYDRKLDKARRTIFCINCGDSLLTAR